MKRALVLVPALLLAPPAAAYNSLDVTGNHIEARPAARTMYNSEHKLFMNWTLINGIGLTAGAPWNQTYDVWVPTGDTNYPDLGNPANPNDPNDPWTLIPVDPVDVQRIRKREVNNGSMWAELPDFSYTFYDWWTGNETCPPNPPGAVGTDANVFDECYEFAGWMGSLNSTHFSPQARTNWSHYHQLAMAMANKCSVIHARMGYGANSASGFASYLSGTVDCGADGLCAGDVGYPGADAGEGDGVDDFLEQCQLLSLWLEATGHHYFEDSWSAGHMWQRWGSPNPAAFPGLEVGLAVAMTSGTIHGSKGGTGSNDRMCSGGGFRYAIGSGLGMTIGDSAAMYSANTGPDWNFHDALGDYHFTDVQSGSSTVWSGTFWGNYDTTFQYDRMMECTIASARQVYNAGPQIYGAPQAYTPPSGITNPYSSKCHDQRATNDEMYDGSKLDYGRVALPLDAGLVYGGIVYKSGVGAGDAATLLGELTRVRSRLSSAEFWDGDGFDASTNTERYALGNFMGIASNEGFNALPAYADPSMPWDASGGAVGTQTQRDRLVAAFHRTYADHWCENTTRQEINDLRRTCQNSTDPALADAACQMCEELGARHVRIGCSPTDYDTTKEPLCALVADNPSAVEYLYFDLDATDPLAQDAATAASDFCRNTSPSYGPCVETFAVSPYGSGGCFQTYIPYYGWYCSGCSGCVLNSPMVSTVGSPYDEDDLNYFWQATGDAYVSGSTFDQPDAMLLWNYIPVYTCGINNYGSANITLEVCDPWYSNCTTAFDFASATCSGW